MLELISMIAAIVLIVLAPIQTGQVCAGKISPKFKGTPEAYVASWGKQLLMLTYLGGVLAVLDLAMLLLPSDEPGERIFGIISAALWAGVLGVSLWSRQRLAKMQAIGGGAPTAS